MRSVRLRKLKILRKKSKTNAFYIAEFWEYDTRIGRRWNVDPVVKLWESPYLVNSGNPIWFSDPNGDEPDKDRQGKKGERVMHSDGIFYTMLSSGNWGATSQNVVNIQGAKNGSSFLNRFVNTISKIFTSNIKEATLEKGGMVLTSKEGAGIDNPLNKKSKKPTDILEIDLMTKTMDFAVSAAKAAPLVVEEGVKSIKTIIEAVGGLNTSADMGSGAKDAFEENFDEAKVLKEKNDSVECDYCTSLIHKNTRRGSGINDFVHEKKESK